MKLTTIVGLFLFLAVPFFSYSKERYRVQNVEGKVLESHNSRSEKAVGNHEIWHKVKRNQWISEFAVLDISAGGKIRICDTHTCRIYKSQRIGRINIRTMIMYAEKRASRVTYNVIKQLKGYSNKPPQRYRQSGRVVADYFVSEEELRTKDSINTPFIDYYVFHQSLETAIKSRIKHESSFIVNGLKGILLSDSIENVYLKVRNETSNGLFINVFISEQNNPSTWLSIIDQCFYLPKYSEIDLMEYPIELKENTSILLLGTEDCYDESYLKEIHFTPSDTLKQKTPLSLIIPRLKINN